MWIECSKLCVKFGVIITFCSDNPGHGLPLVWRDINTKSEILPILTLMAIQTNKNVSPNPQFLVWLEISSFALLIDAKSLYQNSSLPWSKSGGAQTCPETRNCRILERISLQTFSHSLNSTHISHLTLHAPNKLIYHREIAAGSKGQDFPRSPSANSIQVKTTVQNLVYVTVCEWNANDNVKQNKFLH